MRTDRRAWTPFLLCMAFLAIGALASEIKDSRPVVFAGYVSLDGEVDTSTVRIFLDGVDVTPRAEVTKVRVSFRPETPLAVGPHHVRVLAGADDKAVEKAWSFTVAPADRGDVDIFLPAGPRVFFYPLPTPTNSADHRVRGLTLPGAEVELFVNGVPYGMSPASTSGEFYFPGVRLEEGPNDVAAVAADSATGAEGRMQYLRPAPFVDTAPPVIVSVWPRAGASLKPDKAEIRAAFHDAGGVGVDPAAVRLLVDGASRTAEAEIDEHGLTYRPPSGFAPGRHDVALEVSDRLVNVSAPSATWFTVPDPARDDEGDDDDDPGADPQASPVIASPVSGSVLNTNRVDVRGASAGGHWLVLLVNGALAHQTMSDAGGAFLFRGVKLAEGASVLIVEDREKSLPAALRSQPVTVTVRTGEPPTPTPDPVRPVILSPPHKTVLKDPVVDVSGIAAVGRPLALTVNGKPRGEVSSDAGGGFAFRAAGLFEGENLLVVEDRAPGQPAPLRSDPVKVMVRIFKPPDPSPDPVRPVILSPPHKTVLKDPVVDVSGLAAAGHPLVLTVNGKPCFGVSSDAGGGFAFRGATLFDGENLLVVEDRAPGLLSPLRSDPVKVLLKAGPADDPDEDPDDPDEDPDDPPDLVRPVITSPADGAKLTEPRVDIQGTAGAKDPLTVYINGEPRDSRKAGPHGTFWFHKVRIDSGENSIVVEAAGPDGATVASDPVVVSLSKPPGLRAGNGGPRILAPARGSVVKTRDIRVEGIAPGLRVVRLLVNGVQTAETKVSASGRFVFPSVYLDSDLNELALSGTDLEGRDTVSERPVLVRCLAPRAPAGDDKAKEDGGASASP